MPLRGVWTAEKRNEKWDERNTAMFLNLMYITNDPAVAVIAEKNGVERVWVDLEMRGKAERQFGRNTVLSRHTVSDVARLSRVLTKSELLVRVNPLDSDSEREIEQVLEAGADVIMLPMWRTPDEVRSFLRLVNGRAKTVLLLETRQAVECVDEVLAAGGFDEIHIGLNDLHLSYRLTFLFELLTNGVVERLCEKFRRAGIPYGFGGVAAIGGGLLPAERIVMEHYRLGSTRVILSRSFCSCAPEQPIEEFDRRFTENIRRLQAFEDSLPLLPPERFEENRREIGRIVDEIVKNAPRCC